MGPSTDCQMTMRDVKSLGLGKLSSKCELDETLTGAALRVIASEISLLIWVNFTSRRAFISDETLIWKNSNFLGSVVNSLFMLLAFNYFWPKPDVLGALYQIIRFIPAPESC
jgi:hypothetical protein